MGESFACVTKYHPKFVNHQDRLGRRELRSVEEGEEEKSDARGNFGIVGWKDEANKVKQEV